MTDDLVPTYDVVAFLLARLDEDGRIARATKQPDDRRWEAWHMAGEEAEGATHWGVRGVAGPSHIDELNKAHMLHIARHDPARVLAEVDAKRRSLARIEYHAHLMGRDEIHGDLLRLLASVYADHPDYREEWRP